MCIDKGYSEAHQQFSSVYFCMIKWLRIILFPSSGKVLFMKKIIHKILPPIQSSLKQWFSEWMSSEYGLVIWKYIIIKLVWIE